MFRLIPKPQLPKPALPTLMEKLDLLNSMKAECKRLQQEIDQELIEASRIDRDRFLRLQASSAPGTRISNSPNSNQKSSTTQKSPVRSERKTKYKWLEEVDS